MTTSLKTGIIGAGRIASGFGDPDSETPLCLAHAIQSSELLNLGGFYDQSESISCSAETKWSASATPRNFTSWLALDWDVICIASPDQCHADHLETLLSRTPSLKAILAEKPLSLDLNRGELLLNKASSLNIPLLTNFPRRQHPEVKKLSARAQAMEFGQLKRVQITCSGGLLHNGSHAIDLLASFIPSSILTQLKVDQIAPQVFSIITPDESSPIQVILLESVQESCNLWEMTLDFLTARITLRDSPETLTLFQIKPHPVYEGFSTLETQEKHLINDEPLLSLSCRRLEQIALDPQEAIKQLELEMAHHHLLALFFPPSSPDPS
jgi:hypothetical protein